MLLLDSLFLRCHSTVTLLWATLVMSLFCSLSLLGFTHADIGHVTVVRPACMFVTERTAVHLFLLALVDGIVKQIVSDTCLWFS